jgi:hypothetical protein
MPTRHRVAPNIYKDRYGHQVIVAVELSVFCQTVKLTGIHTSVYT